MAVPKMFLFLTFIATTVYVVNSHVNIQSREVFFSDEILPPQNRPDSEETCHILGGQKLLAIKDELKDDLLKRFILEIIPGAFDWWYRIDGYKAPNTTQWIWKSTGEPITYFNWVPGWPQEPEYSEACMIYKASVGFKDELCNIESNFICEDYD